jgi:predicted lipoprotein
MKKYSLPVLVFLVCAFALYQSVYFEKLDLKIQRETRRTFSPGEAVHEFWKTALHEILDSAIALRSFDSLLVANHRYLISTYGKTVGISSEYSFLVKGVARVAERDAERIPVVLEGGNATYNLRVRHIFGNSARDAVGCFKVDDFENTMDFNAVAAELNTLIVKEVVADTFDGSSPGTTVSFVGAVAIDAEHRSQQWDIVPLHIEIIR